MKLTKLDKTTYFILMVISTTYFFYTRKSIIDFILNLITMAVIQLLFIYIYESYFDKTNKIPGKRAKGQWDK